MTTIRAAVEGDEPELTRIDLATWTTAVSPSPPPDRASYRFFGGRTSLADVLVAEVGGAVVGHVQLGRSSMPSHAHVVELNGLAVDPDRQGSGIGERLVRAALEEAHRRGASRVTLRVLAGNAVARRLYERCGFTVEGVLRGEFVLDGRAMDDVLMAHTSGVDRRPGRWSGRVTSSDDFDAPSPVVTSPGPGVATSRAVGA